ncbi:MAG: extracellular solute-binding protein [Chloroflexi bacterium]|nr:extracellular solute-binding protein [Chloroflexota bacterium]
MKKTLFVLALFVLSMLLVIMPTSAQSDPVTINIFAPQSADRDLTTDVFSTSLEEMFNVKFNWTTTTYDNTDASEKRNLALASGDYPDLFMLIPWVDQFSQIDLLKYGQQGVILPLNDLIDQYAPNIKAALEKYPDLKSFATSPDGTIWGMPQFIECYHCSFANKMWVNSTWMKKLNISTPVTTEDFKNMLVAFQTQDANGDGKPDEVLGGATMDYGTRPIPYLMDAFTYDDDRTFLILNDGKVDTVANTQAWKDGLTYIKSLYDAGVLDESAFTNNADAYSAEGNNAAAEMLGAAAGMHPAIFVTCFGAAEVKPYCYDYDAIPPLTGPDGTQFASYLPNTVPGATFVLTNKASQDVQIAAIKMLDYMFTFDGHMAGIFGVKGVDWREPEPGELANNQSVKPLYKTITNDPPTPNNSWGAMAQYLDDVAIRDAWVQSPDIYSDDGYEHRLLLATDLYNGHQSPNLYPFWLVWPDPAVADEQALLKQNINDYINSNTLAFVTGTQNLDTDWDSYVQGLSDLGLARYLEINQAAYDAYKKLNP